MNPNPKALNDPEPLRREPPRPAAIGGGWGWIAFFALPLTLYLAASLYPYFRYMEHRDLHVWVQSAWNTMHGNWFHITIVGCNQLGVHFSWILIAFVPVIALFRTPAALLVLQALALASAVQIGLRLAVRVVPDRSLAVWFSVTALLLHPALLGSAEFGFYAANFQTVFLLGGFLAVESGRERRAWLLFLLALSCKVDVAITLAFYGLYRAAFRREVSRGLALTAAAAFYFVAAEFWIMPALRSGADLAAWTSRYAHLGGGPVEAARALASDPLASLGLILNPRNVVYLVWLLAPAWFLPLAGGATIAALPAIGMNLLSSFDVQTSLLGPYDAGIVAVLFYAGCRVLARLRRRREAPPRRWKIAAAVSVALLLASVSPPFRALVNRTHRFTNPPLSAERIAAAKRIEKLIPPGASLAVDIHLAPRVAMRRTIESPIRDVREIAAGLYDYVWVDLSLLDADREEAFLSLADAHYRVAARDNDLVLLVNRRLPPGSE